MTPSESLQQLKDSIDCLKKVVSEGFARIHTGLDKPRHDFKEDLDAVKDTIKKSFSSTQEERTTLKPSLMNKRILDLNKKPNEIQYTRRRKSAIQQH